MAHASPAPLEDGPAVVDVPANLAAVKAEVQDAARAAGRDAGEITLIAVSKGHPASRILPALAAGHATFGENRVQEASKKWQSLRAEWPSAVLHYIGALQTNKARDAVAVADAIHAIDRPKLAAALAREMDRQGKRPDCFIQVNTGAESQKAGALPDDLDALVAQCRDDLMLPVIGLMCIPPAAEDPAPHFALLRELAARHGLEGLSMGMSADYRTAIALGATHVRIGTAIFGARPRP
ncbi:MAG: YggS family pyridoxal phosphate-dependent enzyme [Rhodospirillaceae bacterium]|nr:YggS family pyridoxal phosphate-dependent enzyme [Rhodospirillaceae bacterium]